MVIKWSFDNLVFFSHGPISSSVIITSPWRQTKECVRLSSGMGRWAR